MKTWLYIFGWAVLCTLVASLLHLWFGWDRDVVLVNLYGASWAYLAFEVRDQRARADSLQARIDSARQSLINAMEGRRG